MQVNILYMAGPTRTACVQMMHANRSSSAVERFAADSTEHERAITLQTVKYRKRLSVLFGFYVQDYNLTYLHSHADTLVENEA